MREEWSTEDLVAAWTLVDEDWQLVGNKTGPTRLGFALLLKFFEIGGRFPRATDELPTAAIAYVAEQVQVDAAEVAAYRWSGRTIEYHRSQVREVFGFRESTRGDEDKLAGWLAEEVCPVELRDEQLREALLVRCRAERIEPPGRVERIIGSARATFEQRFCERTTARLGAACRVRLAAEGVVPKRRCSCAKSGAPVAGELAMISPSSTTRRCGNASRTASAISGKAAVKSLPLRESNRVPAPGWWRAPHRAPSHLYSTTHCPAVAALRSGRAVASIGGIRAGHSGGVDTTAT